jgi:hypothetical protein
MRQCGPVFVSDVLQVTDRPTMHKMLYGRQCTQSDGTQTSIWTRKCLNHLFFTTASFQIFKTQHIYTWVTLQPRFDAIQQFCRITRQAVNVTHNTEERSRNHCCCGKAISITYSSHSYPACKAHAPYYIVICRLWLYHVFPHYLINGTIFGKRYWI